MKYALLFLLLGVNGLGQNETKVRCEIQDLAIAAALGNPDAQYDLAVEFHKGEAVPQDLAKSAELWRMAAKAGVISAYNNLGHLTYYGRGIKQNFAEGIRLWRVAASNGHPESQVHLGYAYSDGKYLKPNLVEAYAWSSAGKYSAGHLDDPELSKSIVEMVTKLHSILTLKLSARQLAHAEQRTKLYISRYGNKRVK